MLESTRNGTLYETNKIGVERETYANRRKEISHFKHLLLTVWFWQSWLILVPQFKQNICSENDYVYKKKDKLFNVA